MDLDKDALMWEEIECNHIVQNEWIDFRESTYRFPDGSVASPYYSYSRRDYVVIVASDEDGKYICVNQFRQGIKDVTTEFPAGGIERKDGKEYGVNSPEFAEDAMNAAINESKKKFATKTKKYVNKKEAIIPDWVDKDIQKEEISEEEENEVKDLLKEFV